MPKPKFPYAGDAALKRLLEHYRCPFPLHVVRMRFWGKTVSPSLRASDHNDRVEELYDGFTHGFTGGNRQVDVPPGVGDLLGRVEKSIELLAIARNTFAKPPGPGDGAMLAELRRVFREVDRAVQADLNAIAIAIKDWRKDQALALRSRGTTGDKLH